MNIVNIVNIVLSDKFRIFANKLAKILALGIKNK